MAKKMRILMTQNSFLKKKKKKKTIKNPGHALKISGEQ
jgi:hypothetical protein